MARTVWLASYPKSGNTWFRIFLANLLHPEQAPVDLNNLPERTPIASSRGHFDDLLGVPSALLTQAEIDRLRPAADAELARAWDEPLLVRKAHDGYRDLPDGRPLMGQGPDFAALYILREPWDVAVSMTAHFGCTLEQAVANLCHPEFAVAKSRKGLSGQLRQDLGTWEAHATGWLQAPMDLCLLRYEAMQAAPLGAFRRAVHFLGLAHDDAAIVAALEASRFERLQRQEAEQRFREAPPRTRAFFRHGQVGEGLTRLSEQQREPLEAMRSRVEALIAARGAGGMNRYRYCGLTLAADLPLPELPSAAPDNTPDLEIRIGPVPETLPEETRRTATFAHNGREALWWLDGVGRFQVATGGRRITVAPAPTADEASLRLMLLQPVFALASVLRGDGLLNAAAVAREGQVSAFIGPSASGKSTAAALLVQQGDTLVSDGLLRLTRDASGRFLAHPQAPWLQLWPDAIHHLGWARSEPTPVRPGLALQRLPMSLSEQPLPLARIGLLREQRGNDLDDFVPSRRPGARGFETLLQHTAGSTWLDDLADRRALFQWGAALTAQTRIEHLEVPWGWDRLEQLAAQLTGWCGDRTGHRDDRAPVEE